MDAIPLCIVEWFVVPLVMFLLLFWWRDNLNILHMPLADLVALLVIADVAIIINYGAFPELLKSVDVASARAPDSAHAFGWLALFGVAGCAVLVYQIEKKILLTVLHHISVGVWHKPSATYLSFLATCRSSEWRRFLLRWAAGFGVTAVIATTHLVAVGIYPLGPLHPELAKEAGRSFIEAAAAGIAAFLVFLALGVLLTLIRFFRYSATELAWTK